MKKLLGIHRDYKDAGALHELVGIEGVIGDGVFGTKSGDLVLFLRLDGVDYEGLDPAQMNTAARRFEAASSIFGDEYRIYQYLLKRDNPAIPCQNYANPVIQEASQRRRRYLERKAGKLYSYELYLAVTYMGARPTPRWQAPLRTLLSEERTLHTLKASLDAGREKLINKASAFCIQLSDVMRAELLGCQAAFQFLRRLLNYSPSKAAARLQHSSSVDFQVCGSALECHRNYLRLDDDYVKLLTLKEPPARTFPHLLRGLLEIRCNAVIVSEWKREDAGRVRRLVQSKRRHHHNSKSSLLNYLNTQPGSGPKDMLIDDGAVAMTANLGACLEEMEVRGRSFGQFSLTVILYHKDEAALHRAVAECFKVFSVHDAQLTEERYNLLNAWLAVQPGNADYNLRRLWLTDANYADLSFLYTLQSGAARNEHLGGEALAVLEGTGGAPYFLNLHHNDIAHTLVLGSTGSGKSFLLNFILMNLQKYGPYTFIFDLGGSYESLTHIFGGSYLAVGAPDRAFTINPFCLPPTSENHLFLFAFVKVLIESNGYRMSSEEERDLFEQIENLYEVAPDQRRLLTLSNILHRNLRRELQKWVQGGPYASLFDNVVDNLTLARFQTFDFEGMDKAPVQLEALLFYILHRANALIAGPGEENVFKVFVMDEAWRFFRHPTIRAYIIESLKTWRKKNAAMILATQSGEDLLASEMLPVVVESCPTKLFLANPGMNREAYQTAFHLNETEADLIAGLIPKKQFLLKQPGIAKLLNLEVDDKEYWIYTNNPADNARKREAFQRYGFRAGLEQLAKEKL
jgi:type IV secretion system protein VirB4